MAKEDKSVWKIFFEGLKIFCFNFSKFFLYMAFPVLGQILGLVLIFGLTYWYTESLPDLIQKFPAFNNFSTILIVMLLITVPGLLIWAKAFWDYLVAYGALNSMTEGALNTGRVYDFAAHKGVVTKKTFSFIALWFLFGIFTLLAVIPVFWVLGFIFFIYFILIFQVFTFESDLSPIGYFKKSLELVKGKFARTFLLMTILGLITYVLLTSGVSVIFDYLNLTEILAKVFEGWVSSFPLEQLEKFNITPLLISKELVKQLIFLLVVGFTLPLRSICWTLWYKNLNTEEPAQVKKKTKKTEKKKPSKMEGKSFKIEKREIDPEIIRRARWEDDEY